MRLTFSESEFDEILSLAQSNNKDTLVLRLLEEQEKSNVAKSSENLKKGAKKATKLREYRCKVRILLIFAINHHYKKDSIDNISALARASETSINTVKKYIKELKYIYFEKRLVGSEYEKDINTYRELFNFPIRILTEFKERGIGQRKANKNEEFISRCHAWQDETRKFYHDLGFKNKDDFFFFRTYGGFNIPGLEALTAQYRKEVREERKQFTDMGW